MSDSKDSHAYAQIEYTGYQPLCAADFPFREDEDLDHDVEKDVDPLTLTDNTKRSKSLLFCMIYFAVCFIVLLVWQVLVAKCVVSALCETNDSSSESSSIYLFQTYTFRVPSALVWIGLTVSSLVFTIASKWMFDLLRIGVGPVQLLELSMIMRRAISVVLIHQYFVMFVPLLITFILIGVGINWKTGACFILGGLFTALAGRFGVSVATRAQVRTAAQAHDDVKGPFKVAYRSGSIISAAVIGIAVLASSALYLLVSDVRALAGLAAGSTAVSLFMRISAGIFSRATNATANTLCENNSPGVQDAHDAPLIAAYAGSGLGAIMGSSCDAFASVVSAVAATAILGSSLPFFYRNSFAMCVFNHLYVDQVCGPFGYPQRLSYATYICNEDNLYLEYPSLRTWASNSAFVAVPFVLAVIGVLVSVVCTIYPLYGKYAHEYESQALCVIRGVRMTMRRNYIIGYVLFVAGSAALCFGLFGPHSEFQKNDGFGKNKVARMELDGSPKQCGSRYLNFSSNLEVNPVPIPQGGNLIMDYYRPLTVAGASIGNANTTAWRLFGCILIGVVLSSITTGISCDHFTSVTAAPTAKVSRTMQQTPLRAIAQVLGSGLVATAIPSVLVVATILSSYKLFGAYGTGIATLGFLCSGGSRTTVTMMSYLADSANNIASASRMRYWRRTFSEVLSLVASTTTASNIEFTNGASVLTACTIILAVVHQSGLIPSPRDLVGSPEFSPFVFFSNSQLVPLSDIVVIVSIIAGAMVPFALTGLLVMSAVQCTDEMTGEAQQYSASSTDHGTFFVQVSRLMLLESVSPVTISVFVPLVIGFGFGQRALIGLLLSLVSAGYVLGTFLTCAASSWKNAERHVEADLTPSEQLPRENARYMPRLIRGGRGRFSSEFVGALHECAGPGLQSLTKFSPSISLVLVTLMRPDESKGWVGGVIFAVVLVSLLAFTLVKNYWWTRRSDRLLARSAEDATTDAPRKQVSPFYVEGPMIDPTTVLPGSQVHDALRSIGSPTAPVSPKSLPGIFDEPLGSSDRV